MLTCGVSPPSKLKSRLKSKLFQNLRTKTCTSQQQLFDLVTNPVNGNGTPIHDNKEGMKMETDHNPNNW